MRVCLSVCIYIFIYLYNVIVYIYDQFKASINEPKIKNCSSLSFSREFGGNKLTQRTIT
jgi:hypothetical protein